MMPGIINQINLEWDASINYYLPTLKRYGNKFYYWLRPSGPNLGGAKIPGGVGSDTYWALLDFAVTERVNYSDISNWNDMKADGKFLMRTVKDVTLNVPENLTGYWWLEVSTCHVNNNIQVLQVARFHDPIGTSRLTATVKSRSYDGSGDGVWSAWHYDYAEYSG